MIRFLSSVFIILLFVFEGFCQLIATGIVTDKETGDPLPYATIGFQNTSMGTVANANGDYSLKLPANFEELILEISFLGYESFLVSATEIKPQMDFKLKPSFMQLAELVIRPLSPQDYIKRAVRKIPKNYASSPYQTDAYYREKVTENESFLALNEIVFQSYYPNYQDTIKNQHKILLYRKADNLAEVQFMSEWADKREKKREKKKVKKPEPKEVASDTTNTLEAGLFVANFGGPDQIFSSDLVKDLEDFLDSTRFKKYRYQFLNGVNFQGRELLVIGFKSRGQVDNLKSEGSIYIDIRSDAIVAVDYEAEGIIPILVRPLLFAFGVSIDDIFYKKSLRYREIDGIWYLEKLKNDLSATVKKRHMFNANEVSAFNLDQVFDVINMQIEDIYEISENERYNSKNPIEKQVYQSENLIWSDINTVVLEEL